MIYTTERCDTGPAVPILGDNSVVAVATGKCRSLAFGLIVGSNGTSLMRSSKRKSPCSLRMGVSNSFRTTVMKRGGCSNMSDTDIKKSSDGGGDSMGICNTLIGGKARPTSGS